MISVRVAEPVDARAVAEIHVRSWRATYRGLLSESYLNGLSVDRREAFWSDVLTHLTERRQQTILAERDGTIIGFVAGGPTRDDAAGADIGEVYALYLAPEAWRAGIGRVLNEAIVGWLRDEGFVAATLWVLDRNERARAFYEATGWRADGVTKREEWPDGTPLDEVRYRLSLSSRGG